MSQQFLKRHEWDFLDQKKEKEEMLLLEMVSLRHAAAFQLDVFNRRVVLSGTARATPE